MPEHDSPIEPPDPRQPKHPPADSIMDLLSFRLSRLVAINSRAGQHWSERLFDISLNEWWIIGVTQAHAPLRPGDLASTLAMDKSQCSRLLKGLVKRKLVKSRPDANDARAVVLSLTKKGRRLHDRVLAEALRRNERVLLPLSRDETIQMLSLLDRLIDHNAALLQAILDRGD